MKFDFCIGNPPYQEELKDTSDKPVYNYFLDEGPKIADKVEMIHPARFLFNAGKTSKEWNRKMLEDEHYKIMEYEQNSKKIFNGVDITGGLAISYYDNNKNFGAIKTFFKFCEMNSILKKVMPFFEREGSLSSIIYPQTFFDLDELYNDFPSLRSVIGSNGNERRIVSSAFHKLSVFRSQKENVFDVAILGIFNSKRTYRFINKKYVVDNGNVWHWKVIVSGSNGAAGTIGDLPVRIIGEPIIIEPNVGYTQSFLGIGAFENKNEAMACVKYLKTKFGRIMLGILKITQNCHKDVWAYVPLQDFTDKSDIDWTKSVHEIDLQLYQKYKLSDEEIQFIEDKVKVME